MVALRELTVQAKPMLDTDVAAFADLQQQQRALERGMLRAFGRTELLQQLAMPVYQCALYWLALWHGVTRVCNCLRCARFSDSCHVAFADLPRAMCEMSCRLSVWCMDP